MEFSQELVIPNPGGLHDLSVRVGNRQKVFITLFGRFIKGTL